MVRHTLSGPPLQRLLWHRERSGGPRWEPARAAGFGGAGGGDQVADEGGHREGETREETYCIWDWRR